MSTFVQKYFKGDPVRFVIPMNHDHYAKGMQEGIIQDCSWEGKVFKYKIKRTSDSKIFELGQGYVDHKIAL